MTAKPTGAADPGFSVNIVNAAKNTVATFSRAGGYTLRATIKDAGNQTVTSSVLVTVNQTLTSITVTPAGANVARNASQQYSATALDQFGNPLVVQPSFTWSLVSGTGSINASGLFTAGATTGPFQVRATSSSINGTASGTVINAAPTAATPAVAAPNPSAGIQSQLSVLGADDGGEANLTYTWTVVSQPAGSPNPTFSASGANAAKNTTVTVSAAGNYVFRATISDGSLTTSSDASLTVNFTLGQRSPIAADVDGNGTVNAQDILAVITLMSAAGLGPASSPLPSGSTPFYYDVNADGIINVFDILGIISYMAAHPPGESEGEGESAAAAPAVQPDSTDDQEAILALVASDVATSRRRWSD